MCELCTRDPEAIAKAKATAERLDRLALFYLDMARGALDPHGEAGKVVRNVATHVIRELVEDWV